MSSLSAVRLDNIYNDLTASISGSVKNIRERQTAGFARNIPEASEGTAAFGSFPLNGYAVYYLEPQVLFNLHRIQENENAGELNGHRQKQGMVSDDGEQNGSDAVNDNQDTAAPVSFLEELQNGLNVPDAKTVTAIYNHTENHGSAVVLENWGQGSFAMGENRYANETYSFNYNLTNGGTDARIEFMHKFNRSFDYRI